MGGPQADVNSLTFGTETGRPPLVGVHKCNWVLRQRNSGLRAALEQQNIMALGVVKNGPCRFRVHELVLSNGLNG